MANGTSASDWAVNWDGGSEGTVACPPYSAAFKLTRIGIVQITWRIGPEPGPNNTSIELAAKKAAHRTVNHCL
jgi:hypothetical protein